MNIAAIVVCYNDDYKIDEWEEHYKEIKNSIYRMIIVDNGSNMDFLEDVKKRFAEATIIELKHNKGCTGAYNAGIKEALSDERVEAIMLIGNDIKILPESIDKLVDEVKKDDTVGMVAPVLLNKDSDIIADAGCFSTYFLTLNLMHENEKYDVKNIYDGCCFTITGGMNLAKRSFYECVGLQDDNLFMYSDEVDIGLRAQKHNLKMKVIPNAVAWHHHINPRNRTTRLPFTRYLIARNKVYLGKKHFGMFRAGIIFMYFVTLNSLMLIRNTLKKQDIQAPLYGIRGAWSGITNNMRLPDDFDLC